MRPPIDINRAYTVLSQTEARRRLAKEFSVPRHQTARMTLDQLHDELVQNVVAGQDADFVIITDRVFRRLASHSDALLLKYHGAPIDPQSGISSLTSAYRSFEDAGVEVPPDASHEDLEDVLSGLNGTRHIILTDEDFEAYGQEMARMLAAQPSGRSASGT